MHPCPARPASLSRAPPPRGGGHHSAVVPRRRRLFRTPARQLVTSQASRPRHVDDVNDGRELPPEPHGRRDAVVQVELECPDPLVGGVVVPEAVLEPPRRRTRRMTTLRPARRRSGGAPPAAGTAPSRRRPRPRARPPGRSLAEGQEPSPRRRAGARPSTGDLVSRTSLPRSAAFPAAAS